MQTHTTKNLVERSPIITIMGHIDHGKSTLLDYIRKSNVVENEAGGITQHLSAYEVRHAGKDGSTKTITFLDTPGHEAFSNMRSRGASVADIAILVVSAEDGVKQQTLDALRAIKEAKIPYIVAINKIDKPNANIERVKQELGENEIYIEGYGGDVPCVPVSAKAGTGVPELLDMMLLVAEIAELKGDPQEKAVGVVIESSVDPKKGIGATLIIKNGSIKKGDCVVAEDALTPVRMMENFLGEKIESASFSSPIRITGWQKIPNIGAPFTVYATKKEAEAAVDEYETAMRAHKKPVTLVTQKPKGEVGEEITEETPETTIPIVIKADVAGTLEAIAGEVMKLETERVKIKLVSKGVGSISENDIKAVAGATNPIIIGFHAKVDGNVPLLAERYGITIKTFDIIYKITEWLAEEIVTRTPKVLVEETTGDAQILKTFSKDKNKQVVGGKVTMGIIPAKANVKIMRRGHEIGRGKILELQQQKLKATEITEGAEFGAMIESKIEITRGDNILSFILAHK